MTWALLGLVATFGGWGITAGVWLRSANRDKDRARDAMEKWQEEANKAHADNRLLEATNVALQGQLDEAKRLKAEAEKERDEAIEDAEQFLVAKLQAANIADSARFVGDLLAHKWRRVSGVLPPRRSDDPKDGLIDPSKD